MPDDPKASVVLVASSGIQSIDRVVSILKQQTLAPDLQLVIAARPSNVSELSQLPAHPLHDISVVPADFSTSARARVAAVNAARGDIVIFCEDHCFPVSSGWASQLLAPYASGHAAVGPLVKNANPDTPLSWSNLLAEYGPWVADQSSGERDFLPGHNSSYRRADLLEYGERLGEMLEVEWVLHRDLRNRGKSLWLAADTASEHLNFSRFRTSVRLNFLEGWAFASSRATGWEPARRALYSISFPAIFAVRLFRQLKLLRVAPLSVVGKIQFVVLSAILLAVNAFGEAIGYLMGERNSREQLGAMEFERWKHLRANEVDFAFKN